MTFEGLLVERLNTITELNSNIYPLCVPESVPAPYICYVQSGGEHCKDLGGYNTYDAYHYEINILSEKYKQLKILEKEVYKLLNDLIGDKLDENIIQDIDISSPNEQYEEAIKLRRANIEFTVYFEGGE